MKRKVEETAESVLDKTSQLKTKRIEGAIFHKVNIYTLKYLVDSYSQNPTELREKLLKYTKLSLPYCQDIYIESDFISQEEINFELGDDQPDSTSIKSYNTSKKSLTFDNNSCIEDITDEEYGQVILKLVEIFGSTIELRARSFLQQFNIPKELVKEIQSLLSLKTKYFYIMMQKTFEDIEEEKEAELFIQDKSYFKSIYDLTIEQIYLDYKGVIVNPESRANIKNVIEKITNLIDEVMSVVSLTELSLSQGEDSQKPQYILSFREQTNLIQLREAIINSGEYFAERLKNLFKRQFFYWKETIDISQINENADKFCFFPMNSQVYLNDKIADILKNSICAIGNSQGGMIFLGIHNLYNNIRAISLQELTSQNILGELKKLAFQITPKLDCEFKLINVVKPFKFQDKDNSKNDYIISIVIKSRKPKEIYQISKNFDKTIMIRNNGFNQKLKRTEIQQLTETRSKETTVPDLLDYLVFNESYNPIEFTQNLASQQQQKSNTTARKNNFEDKRSGNDLKIDDLTWKLIEENSKRKKNGKSNSHDNSTPQLLDLIALNKRDLSATKLLENKRTDLESRSTSMDIQDCQNDGAQNQKELKPKIPVPGKNAKIKMCEIKEQVLSNPQISGLEKWKQNVLVEFFNCQYNTSYDDFVNSPILRKYIPFFNELHSMNAYMVYKIDGKYRVQFRDAVNQAFDSNNIPMEYIGNLMNFTILKVDREKHSYKIDRLITPISIHYSFNNRVLQGFNFDNFEIKFVSKIPEAINIIDIVLKALGTEFEIKYVQGKLLVCFTQMTHFLYSYDVFVKIRKLFEDTESSRNVFSRFNQQIKI